MKPSELRIGNYVSTKEGKVIRIDRFECFGGGNYEISQREPVNVYNGETKVQVALIIFPFTWKLEDLKPIPLTEEWLLKFGFYFDFGVYWSELGTIKVKDTYGGNSYSLTLFEYDEFVDLHKPFQYVHQLQNLHFTLTGEELKLKEIK